MNFFFNIFILYCSHVENNNLKEQLLTWFLNCGQDAFLAALQTLMLAEILN